MGCGVTYWLGEDVELEERVLLDVAECSCVRRSVSSEESSELEDIWMRSASVDCVAPEDLHAPGYPQRESWHAEPAVGPRSDDSMELVDDAEVDIYADVADGAETADEELTVYWTSPTSVYDYERTRPPRHEAEEGIVDIEAGRSQKEDKGKGVDVSHVRPPLSLFCSSIAVNVHCYSW